MYCCQSSYDEEENYGDNLDSDMISSPVAKDTLGENNVGFKMLQKFGWKGSGLGKSEQGITEPVKVVMTDATLGIGKAAEYEKNIAEVTRDRKKMDVEIDQTADIISKKKEAADRQELIESDLKAITQEFYCESCDKQYKNVAEMSNHLSSYDHHHRKRFKEMKDVAKKRKRGFAIGESDDARKADIRRKEEKREAKEMENRINKAKAVQELSIPTPSSSSSSSSSSTSAEPASVILSSILAVPPPVPPPRRPALSPSDPIPAFVSSSSGWTTSSDSNINLNMQSDNAIPPISASSEFVIPFHADQPSANNNNGVHNKDNDNNNSSNNNGNTHSRANINQSGFAHAPVLESVPNSTEEIPVKKFSFAMKGSLFMKKK